MMTKKTSTAVFKVIVFSAILILTYTKSWAGAMVGIQGAEQPLKIEVVVHGLTDFGTTQLLDYLLRQLPGVTEVAQTGLSLMPLEPRNCRAAWSVQTAEDDAEILQQELMAALRELDPEKQNDSLYEAPFLVTKEVLVEVKRVVPVLLSPARLDLATQHMAIADDFRYAEQVAQMQPGLPWYKRPGMGFE